MLGSRERSAHGQGRGTYPVRELTAFEQEFADYCYSQYGISVNYGLDAIRWALLALGIGEGDEMITVDNGCSSDPLAITHTGATPVFVDIDEHSHNMDPEQIELAITPQTKAVLRSIPTGNPVTSMRSKPLLISTDLFSSRTPPWRLERARLYDRLLAEMDDPSLYHQSRPFGVPRVHHSGSALL